MIDPHSPIVSQDSQAGQEPGMEEQKMATPKSKLLTPLSLSSAGPTLVLQSTEQIIHISDNPWLVRPGA